MSRDVNHENFEEWNEEMIRRFDPERYHEHPSPLVRFIERRRVSTIIDLLGARSSHRVLEVGCGAGNILEQMPRGADLHGIDISDYILEKARRRLGDRAKIVKADAEALPYENSSIDRVYCSEVLEHVLSPGKVLAEMRRVVRPDGVVVVSVPNEGLIDRLKGILSYTGPLRRIVLGEDKDGYKSAEKMTDEWHLHHFTREMLEREAGPSFVVRKMVAVPSRALPLRWVAQLQPR
jgi:ubiquinone/menaquinone biosynthesis C-methylase UbiE